MINRSVIWKHLGVEYQGYIYNIHSKKDRIKVDVLFNTGEWISGIPLNAIYKNAVWTLSNKMVPETIREQWLTLMRNIPLIFMVRVQDKGNTRFISVKACNDYQATECVRKHIKGVSIDSVVMSMWQFPDMHHNLIQAV
jgi:hypothetical protein